MDLRYRLAVVTGAGGGLGREVAVALSRVGAAVLSVDPDLAAADQTAAQVEEARVKAWALQVDMADDDDVHLLVDRARDLGGMDLLVMSVVSGDPGAVPTAPTRLTELFVEGLAKRRGRSDGSPAAVLVCGRPSTAHAYAGAPWPTAARVMAVVPRAAGVSEVARAVVDLLAHGSAGAVVELPG